MHHTFMKIVWIILYSLSRKEIEFGAYTVSHAVIVGNIA